MTRILVIASTLPWSSSDPIPAFVKDQVAALHAYDPDLTFRVLAPHDYASHTRRFQQHESYDEYRFHYIWPFRLERLAGRGGIMPALKRNPLNYLLIPFLFIGEFTAMLRHTHAFKPDLLYAHWFTPQAVIAYVVGTLTRTPFVFTSHALDVAVWRKVPFIGSYVVHKTVRNAHRFSAVSEQTMQKVKDFFSREEWDMVRSKAKIIPMGITVPEMIYTDRPSAKTVVFVGRLVEKKGVEYLLKAFTAIIQKHSDARLVIAGDGPLMNQLVDLASVLKIADATDFVGYVSGEKKTNLLCNASVYVVPSIIADDGDAEGLPVSLLEGLAYSNICVATNESGASEIITNSTSGFLVPQKDVDALESAILTALEMTPTSEQTIRSNAHAVATNYSWERIAEQHVEFLLQEIPRA